jgi:hypothetical protein
MKVTTDIYAYAETLKGLQRLKPFDNGDLMASESSGTDFDARVY